MALSPELEQRIAELHAGIASAPVVEVYNERAQLAQVLDALETLKGSKSLTPEQTNAIAEVKGNIATGASVVMNKRATLLVVFACIESLKSEPKPVKVESTKG
jgi:hypothetical protein